MIESQNSSPAELKKVTCTPVSPRVPLFGDGTNIKMSILCVLSCVLEVKEHVA